MSSKGNIEVRRSALWAAVILAAVTLLTWWFLWGVIHGAINVYPFYAPGIEVWRAITTAVPNAFGFSLAVILAAVVQFIAVFAIVYVARLIARVGMVRLRKAHDRVMADDI